MKFSQWFNKNSSSEEAKPRVLPVGLHNPPFISFVAESSNGKTRDHNEDSIYTFIKRQLTGKGVGSLGLFMVADGMGGHVNGELASKTAVETASRYLLNELIEPLHGGQLKNDEALILQAIEKAFLLAQEAVLSKAQGSGTTLTLLMVADADVYYGHVGDSRLYAQTRAEGLQCLTTDHSLVRRLIDLGQIDAAAARSHPQRNILFRALGQGDGFKVDLGSLQLCDAATFLLCSDGLWGLVEHNLLARYLRPGRQNEETARRLVALANEAGGTDNISAIVITVS
ncbi:MAG: protein phosphatase 2C domain-containing protein [Anaerolineaceae bacterium]|nr:protein phosphatase 2C domain-containing protein [Anaerolineaceae bacterium]